MKNNIIILSILVCFSFLNTNSSQLIAQNVQSSPVNFVIKKIKNLPDQGKLKLLIDMELTDAEAGILTGVGVLSMCSCYCDSIWDAWPTPSDDFNIPGTGTLNYFSGGGGDQNIPGLPRNAVLGIRSVEGGIDRDSEFNVWLKYMIDE